MAADWYRLPSGQIFYGEVPTGVVPCRVPSIYQGVQPGESVAAVVPEVAVVDLAADAAEVGDAPVAEVGPAADDEVDGTVERQAAKRTRPRKSAPPKDDELS